MGINMDGSDGTDVNAVCRSRDENLVIVADDSGHVRLFNAPVACRFAAHRAYLGHSSHCLGVGFLASQTMAASWVPRRGRPLVGHRRRRRGGRRRVHRAAAGGAAGVARGLRRYLNTSMLFKEGAAAGLGFSSVLVASRSTARRRARAAPSQRTSF